MIYLLIPIYNEEANLPNLYKELNAILSEEEVYYVFSDDGSSDKSVEVIKTLFKNNSYHIVGDGINHGPGHAFNVGFEWILNNSKDADDKVITMEADCTSDVRLMPKMIAINKLGYDLVLASVYAQGGGFEKTNWIRKFLSACANLLFRFLFDIKVLTLSSFYRVYSIELLRKIKERNGKLISETGFICMLELLLKAIKENATIIEVPMMLYSGKRKGKSKMRIFKTMLAYFRFLFIQKYIKK